MDNGARLLFEGTLILIRGAGDLATGVALRLHRAGFPIVMTELAEPLAVRRSVAFAEAVRTGAVQVEEVMARRVDTVVEARLTAHRGEVAILIDPDSATQGRLRPRVVVDARLAKEPLDTTLVEGLLVVGLGPGFEVGRHVDAVVETKRGHALGRVYWEGMAAPDSGQPDPVRGYSVERVLRAPIAGRFKGEARIGDLLDAGASIGHVVGEDSEVVPVVAPFDGRLRGLIADGVTVSAGLKIGDLDPRREVDWRTVSDKALAVGGGVVEAVLTWLSRKRGHG